MPPLIPNRVQSVFQHIREKHFGTSVYYGLVTQEMIWSCLVCPIFPPALVLTERPLGSEFQVWLISVEAMGNLFDCEHWQRSHQPVLKPFPSRAWSLVKIPAISYIFLVILNYAVYPPSSSLCSSCLQDWVLHCFSSLRPVRVGLTLPWRQGSHKSEGVKLPLRLLFAQFQNLYLEPVMEKDIIFSS